MYHMKNIIDHGEGIILPQCMYHVRNPNETLKDEMNLDIHNQVMKFLKAPNNKMSELEHRQEVLIKKLDTLYDRIKTISSYCNTHGSDEEGKNKTTTHDNDPNTACSVKAFLTEQLVTVLEWPANSTDLNPIENLCHTIKTKLLQKHISAPEEVVLVVDPDNLPWYLNKVLNEPSAAVNLSWHIHSSVPNDKIATIKSFGKVLKKSANESVKINIRLIFKNVSANPELKLSSLAVPIIGTVNILRYLSYVYPKAIPYEDNDYQMDTLLDICHIIEKSSDRNKESYVKQLFSKCKDWIYDNKYSVVDLAAYNVIKQSKSCIKLIPKQWFAKCEKMCA